MANIAILSLLHFAFLECCWLRVIKKNSYLCVLLINNFKILADQDGVFTSQYFKIFTVNDN